jgi:hypothetical protein
MRIGRSLYFSSRKFRSIVAESLRRLPHSKFSVQMVSDPFLLYRSTVAFRRIDPEIKFFFLLTEWVLFACHPGTIKAFG